MHISEISHDHIETPSSVLKVNDELKVMIIDLDSDRGRISLSTKQLEPEPGAMVKNPQLVYDQAEEMAAKFREKMLAAQRGETIEDTVEATVETTEAPEVEATVETTEAPEVEATVETTEAPEVEATAETTEAPEVEATAETTEAPEVEATAETTEAPEVEATAETTEAPEVEATADEEESAAAAIE